MSNRAQMVTRVRQELGDTVAPYIWDDTLLNELVKEASGWYSRQWPFESVAYKDVAAGQRSFDVPPGVFAVVAVECPYGLPLPRDVGPTIGAPTVSGQEPRRQGWYQWGDTVYLLNGAAGPEIGVAKLAMLVQMPWPTPDPVDPWTGPELDERLLVLWACREAWLWHDGQSQRLVRAVGAVSQAERFNKMLAEELRMRRRRVSSRTMEARR